MVIMYVTVLYCSILYFTLLYRMYVWDRIDDLGLIGLEFEMQKRS
jgi:hypothetical protein